MGRFLPFGLVPPPPLPPHRAQYRARVLVNTPLLEAQDCRFYCWCSFIFALLTPSSAQSQGAARAPCSRITWYGGIRDCVQFVLFYLCCICSTFAAKHFFPSRGCSWRHLPHRHSGYFLFPHLPPPPQWEGFAMTSPCFSDCVSLQFAFLCLPCPHHTDGTLEVFDDGCPCRCVFRGGLFCCGAFSVSLPPPTHRRYATGFDGWFALL